MESPNRIKQLDTIVEQLTTTVKLQDARLRARPASIGSSVPVSVLTGRSTIAVATRLPSGHLLQRGRDARQRCSGLGPGGVLLSSGAPHCCCPTAERLAARLALRVCCLSQLREEQRAGAPLQ